jgi:hypothetical protein
MDDLNKKAELGSVDVASGHEETHLIVLALGNLSCKT